MAENDYGMGQIQQGLGQAVNFENERIKTAYTQWKDKYDNLQQDMDTYLRYAGDKDMPELVRKQFFNNAAAIDNRLHQGQDAFPALKDLDEQSLAVLDSFGNIDKDNKLSPGEKLNFKRKLIK